ncbi:MAG: hypothetical protein HY331_02740, partial [Chloroflexi bacterium]|nr:hypothetical protein [Chloroflexota bacterium]
PPPPDLIAALAAALVAHERRRQSAVRPADGRREGSRWRDAARFGALRG